MVRYSDELIEEVRSSSDIVDIISQYVILKKSGRNFFGLCPFHREKSPSFSVSPDKQIFHCFGCGTGGNVFHFIQKIENIGFIESLETLADRSGIILPALTGNNEDNKVLELKKRVYEINALAASFFHEELYKPVAKEAQNYVKMRKLDNKTLKTFILGYAPDSNSLYKLLKFKGFTEEEILTSSLVNKTSTGDYIDRFKKRLMFPICDIRGRVIAFGGRVLDESKPKYINSPENIIYKKGKHLYGLNVAKNNDSKKIIVVEGYMDAISLYQRGITNVVASLGTALTESQGRLLRKSGEQVIISYDSDEAGQVAALRGLDILNNLKCDVRILQLEDSKDPDEYVVKHGSERFKKAIDKSISLVEFKVKLLKKNLDLDNTNDKIKFLNELAKILTQTETKIEQEVYIDKIVKDYEISKEAIYAEINKLTYKNNKGVKTLENRISVNNKKEKTEDSKITEAILKREDLIISLLLLDDKNIYLKIKEKISLKDIKSKINQNIITKLYEQYEKGDININSILDIFKDEEEISHLTEIMSQDFEIKEEEKDKYINKLIFTYIKENLQKEKDAILGKLQGTNITKEERANFEKLLNEIIIKLAKVK